MVTKQAARILGGSGLACAALLLACGGGDGGGGGAAATPGAAAFDTAQLQGRWTTPAGASPAMTALILADADGTASAWLMAQDASRLLKLALRGDRSASGKSYALDPNSPGHALAGQFTATLDAKPRGLALSGVNAAALALEQVDAAASPAVQADAAGVWQASSGDKAQTRQWTLAATGELSGSSSTGCSYAGHLSAMGKASAYQVQFDENCSDGGKIAFKGIATLNAQKNRMTVTATSVDESRGVAVFFTRQEAAK